MDCDYELTYFPAKGRAEFLRLIFAVKGKTFKDTRIGGEQWAEFKPKTPMGAMPVLTITGGEKDMMLCQTNAIANYLGKIFGLHGSNQLEEARISEVLDSVSDTIAGLTKWFMEKDAEKKAQHLKDFEEGPLAKLVKYFNLRRKEGSNGYIIGSKLSIADISFFAFIDQIRALPGLTALNSYPEVEEHYNLIKSNPNITQWQADHEEAKK